AWPGDQRATVRERAGTCGGECQYPAPRRGRLGLSRWTRRPGMRAVRSVHAGGAGTVRHAFQPSVVRRAVGAQAKRPGCLGRAAGRATPAGMEFRGGVDVKNPAFRQTDHTLDALGELWHRPEPSAAAVTPPIT